MELVNGTAVGLGCFVEQLLLPWTSEGSSENFAMSFSKLFLCWSTSIGVGGVCYDAEDQNIKKTSLGPLQR